MFQLIGLVMVVVLIAGALAFTGSPALFSALPFELALIGGAGVGTLVIGNSPRVAGDALAGIPKAMRGAKWKREDYSDLLSGLNDLMSRARRGGMIAIEADIETPETSGLFTSRPRLLADRAATSLITDSLRLHALNPGGKSPVAAHLEDAVASAAQTRHRAVGALNSLADALPALGIVAAVLGIIKTMSQIDQSPDVLGPMIATALLGTFLGVFLAYGLVGPLAARFGQVVDEEMQYLETIKTVITAWHEGIAPATAVELARAGLPVHLRPSVEDIDGTQANVEPFPVRRRDRVA
ncbi:motility-associated protein [Henriciella marina]|uniref:motility-associated protein n=1 Tax=Henriciella marina TaxID=453851 RepID=UPI00035E94A8|nr:motility-associated protein [Henriciella marina]